MANNGAPPVETVSGPDASAADGTAAALARLFGRYQFPAGFRRILLAAATEFAERGFHATTTRDIAATAGLSPAAMYVYFRSKEEVLHQIAASTLDFTIEVAATEAGRPGSPAARLQALVRVLTIWNTYNSQVAHVVLYQNRRPRARTGWPTSRPSSTRSAASSGGWSPTAWTPASSTSPTRGPPPPPSSRSASTWPAGTARATGALRSRSVTSTRPPPSASPGPGGPA